MERSPRAQALELVNKLAARLRADGIAVPRYGVATCFPDTAFDAGPTGRSPHPWPSYE
jgi:hypothetical protein